MGTSVVKTLVIFMFLPPLSTFSADSYWMQLALQEAQSCLRSAHSTLPDDVPVGALCVLGDTVVGRGCNQRELLGDPTAHAETLALRDAARTLGTSHLNQITLYVTLEPCAMCAGALWLSRARRVVFGAWDDKAGACGSVFDVARDPRLNHQLEVKGGVLEDECALLLREFFVARRKKAK